MRVLVRHTGWEWVIIDSTTPAHVIPLSSAAVAHTFDADVFFFVRLGSEDVPLSAAEARGGLGPLSPRAGTRWDREAGGEKRRRSSDGPDDLQLCRRQRVEPPSPRPGVRRTPPPPPSHRTQGALAPSEDPPDRRGHRASADDVAAGGRLAWPGAAPRHMCPGGSARSALRLLLFAPRAGVVDRHMFLSVCTAQGLHGLAHARFDRVHTLLVLTVTKPNHVAQILQSPKLFTRAVRRSTGWRVVVTNDLPGDPLPTSQTARGFATFVDSEGFARQRRRPGSASAAHPGRGPQPRTRPLALSPNPYSLLGDMDEAGTVSHTSTRREWSLPHRVRRDSRLHQPATLSQGVGSAPAHGQQQAAEANPTRARVASRTTSEDIYIGTLNTRDLGTDNALCRLSAISHLMQLRGVAVLAVQETKRKSSDDMPDQCGLEYFGSLAARSRAGVRVGGTGFLVRKEALPFFTYLGLHKRPSGDRVSTSGKYAAHWARLWGTRREEDIWLASVYLPEIHTSTACPGEYERALADLASDMTHYKAKKGTVIVAGDWNARVGHAQFEGMPSALASVAPRYGEDALNVNGKQLLAFCQEHGMAFLSGARPGATGPTCTGHGRNRTTGALGTSIVDHIIAPGAYVSAQAAPPHCFTMTTAAYAPETAGIESDHAPVLLRLPPVGRNPGACRHAARRVAWRLERLQEEDTVAAYQAAVARRAACSPWLLDRATCPPPAKRTTDSLRLGSTTVFGRVHRGGTRHDRPSVLPPRCHQEVGEQAVCGGIGGEAGCTQSLGPAPHTEECVGPAAN